ncbi:MAG: flagellar filament capping protein FliD [Porticoccus sp.]|nr:flagellar filament capping protein FliD [Porticoccus sp.]
MVTATGIGSGLDIEGLVTQLVSAESTPVQTRLTTKEAALTAEFSAFGSLNSALASFQNSLTQLNNLNTFSQRLASASDSDVVDVSADSDAATGNYDLAVTQLAKTHSLASGSYTSASDTVGTGTITIRFGTTDYVSPDPGPESYNSFTVNPEVGVATFTIDDTNNTLAGLRDAINDADIGVSAAIVNDGSGYRLLLNSSVTGEANSLEISVDDTGDADDLNNSGLSALAFNSGATNLSQTVAAQDALFSINGLGVSSSKNIVSDVIDGVTLTLKDVTGEASVSLSISEDQSSVKAAITALVDSYNSLTNTINRLTAYDPETGLAGALQGDFSVRSITSQLRSVLTGSVEGFSEATFGSFSEIGITTEFDGTLSIDSADLDKALSSHFDEIVGLFAAVGFPSDDKIEYLSSTSNTSVSEFDINISQIASQGQLVGALAGFPLDIDDNNDAFTLKVNGVTSNSIELTQGNYTSGESLAAELQARINGDSKLSGADVTVTVTFNTDHFEITSDRYGSASSVEILSIDTNTSAELGLSISAGTNGVDVAGTIGGVAATGSGQTLAGADGSEADGLRLLIDGGATGNRGAVNFSQGVAYQLNTLINSFLKTDGILNARSDGIQSRIDDIEDQRETLDLRMEALEARYRAQFNALDTLLAQLQSTSDFLTQQLASLPEAGSLLNNN